MPETLDHFLILNRVFYHYYTITLLIILITTLQIRIIRVQLVIIRLLLGSWLLLLTHPPGTRVEINLDAVLMCDLAKKLLNLKCFPRTAGGTRCFLDGLDVLHCVLIEGLLGSLGGGSALTFVQALVGYASDVCRAHVLGGSRVDAVSGDRDAVW